MNSLNGGRGGSHLDEIDEAILAFLQIDARETTNTEIAEEIGVSPATVGDRLDQLRSAGVIETTYTAVDYEAAGFPHHLLLTCSAPTTERESIAERTVGKDGVVAVRELLTGEANLRIEVVSPSREAAADTIRSLEDAGVDVWTVEILEAVRRRPFNGLERY